MTEWVAVCADETDEPVEIPTESDGSLLISSVTAQFPGTTGLKFRHPETNKLRGVRIQGEAMYPPAEEGWGPYTYICVRVKPESPKKDESRLKRKTDSDVEMYSKNLKVDDDDEVDADATSDLIVLGLPWKTKEEDIREYFEQYGEVLMVLLKTRPGTGESKGFGFIRFADKEVEKKVLLQRHMIDGRWCDIKYPDSQEKKGMSGKDDKAACKIFVGRVTESLTKDDLMEHFSTFGHVTDVYIPNPFRHFAFVQFNESRPAQSLLGKEHVIKGVSVKIGEASPKGRMEQQMPSARGGNVGGGGGGGGGGGHGAFPGTGFDTHFGAMGFGGPQNTFAGYGNPGMNPGMFPQQAQQTPWGPAQNTMFAGGYGGAQGGGPGGWSGIKSMKGQRTPDRRF